MDTSTIELMARARSGQSEALGQLCELYSNYLRVVAWNDLGPNLRRRVELSDVVQEALVEVVRQFPRFTGQDEVALAAWLRRLVGQKLADLGRYYNRVKRGAGEFPVSLEAPLEAAGSTGSADGHGRLLDVLTLDQACPSEAASRRELDGLLAEALAALPETEAEILRLRHVEGLSFGAIGRRLGIGPKVIRRVSNRGLKALRHAIEGTPGGSLRHDSALVPRRRLGQTA